MRRREGMVSRRERPVRKREGVILIRRSEGVEEKRRNGEGSEESMRNKKE
jgi:hypothetical protein